VVDLRRKTAPQALEVFAANNYSKKKTVEPAENLQE